MQPYYGGEGDAICTCRAGWIDMEKHRASCPYHLFRDSIKAQRLGVTIEEVRKKAIAELSK